MKKIKLTQSKTPIKEPKTELELRKNHPELYEEFLRQTLKCGVNFKEFISEFFPRKKTTNMKKSITHAEMEEKASGIKKEKIIIRDFLLELQDSYIKYECDIAILDEIYNYAKRNTISATYLWLYGRIKKNKSGKPASRHMFYQYFLILLIEKLLLSNLLSPDYNADDVAGWVMKQLSKRADKYQTIAYKNVLRRIWLNGGMSGEFIENVREEIKDSDFDLNDYGIFHIPMNKIENLTYLPGKKYKK